MSDRPARPPRIGIAPLRRRDDGGQLSLVARTRYLEPLIRAGGLPVMLAAADEGLADAYTDALDGLLLPGGADIHPRFYRQEPGAELELEEDDIAGFQLELTRAACRRRLPTLGICLGCQVMAVALGGTLVQHLDRSRPGAVAHRGRGGKACTHAVSVEPGSRLFAALGVGQLQVNSHHHQAIAEPGERLRVTAVAPDAVVEGIELPDLPFFVGVQWHAETGLEQAANRNLFEAFVRAAAAGL